MAEKYKNKYRIEPNRWQFWNYSAPGKYFITICISGRDCILGNIISGKMILSEYGQIVEKEIKKLPEYHRRLLLEVYVIMPNHIHLIIILGEYDFDNGISLINNNSGIDEDIEVKNYIYNPNYGNVNGNVEKIQEFSLQQQLHGAITDEIILYRKLRRKMLMPKILGKFKQQTSKQMNILRNTPANKNWQKDYHEHVIRNNESYQRIINYIINNPVNWKEDKFYQ